MRLSPDGSGSGMVREPARAVRLSRTGGAFLMNMHHDEFGDYQMRNEVVEYQARRRLAWEPSRVAASPEEQEAIGGPTRYRWRYELSPDGPGATMVTEMFDCSRSRRTCARPSGMAKGGGTP